MKAKWLGMLLIGLLLSGLVAGCAAAERSATNQAADQYAKSAESGRSAPSGSAGAPAPPPAAPAGQPAAKPSAGNSGTEATAQWDRMIIRTANLTLVVSDVETALSSVRDIAGAADGFVAKSTSRYEGEFMLADVTIQVPAREYDRTIQSLRRIAVRVDVEKSDSQDVTEEYTDLDSQLRNLQATEASLLKMMDRATQITDILAIQKELTNIRGQIERIQGRMKYLTRRSDMSTIAVSLIPEAKSKAKPSEAWDPVKILARSLEQSLGLLKAIASAILVVIGLFWWLIILGALGAWIASRQMKKRTPPAGPPPPAPAASPAQGGGN